MLSFGHPLTGKREKERKEEEEKEKKEGGGGGGAEYVYSTLVTLFTMQRGEVTS